MKLLFIGCVLLITISANCQTRPDNWGKLNFLIGNWIGEGNGNPGQGKGYFSFTLDLDNKILVRKSHSEYPPDKEKPGIVHDDILIIYHEYNGDPDKAIYFDNEGHVINYSITYADSVNIIFTSKKIPNVPVFRLTYSKLENNAMNVIFAISQDGEKFTEYLKGTSKKIQ